MSGIGFNDRRALLIGLSFGQRIVRIQCVIVRSIGPSGIPNINGLLLMDKPSNDVEDFALLASVENL